MFAIIRKIKCTINFKELDALDISNVCRIFADSENHYTYLEDESMKCSDLTATNTIIMRLNNSALFFVIQKDNLIYELFISSQEEIKLTHYNDLICFFANKFRKFVYENNLPISVYKSRKTVNINLDKIISAPKVRKYFESYLNNGTNFFDSSRMQNHPKDIERLNNFIIAAHRYSKKKINLGLLKLFLVKERKWHSSDAELLCNKVSTGLSILEANKKFYDSI